MGVRWSTPRVLGFSYSTRGTRVHPRGCGAVLGYFVVFAALYYTVWALWHWWALTALVLVVLLAQLRKHRRPARPPTQAAVSNRR